MVVLCGNRCRGPDVIPRRALPPFGPDWPVTWGFLLRDNSFVLAAPGAKTEMDLSNDLLGVLGVVLSGRPSRWGISSASVFIDLMQW